MLLISPVMGERPPAAIAVGHLVGTHGVIADIPTLVGLISGIRVSSAQAEIRRPFRAASF